MYFFQILFQYRLLQDIEYFVLCYMDVTERLIWSDTDTIGDSLVAQTVKSLPAIQIDQSSIPGFRRSPGEGNGNPLQYPCLENLMDRGA